MESKITQLSLINADGRTLNLTTEDNELTLNFEGEEYWVDDIDVFIDNLKEIQNKMR